MSVFSLQPNPPSTSHTKTFTHTRTHTYAAFLLPVASHFLLSLLLFFFSLLSSLLPLLSLSLSLPKAFPRESVWSGSCLFGVQLIGRMGYLGGKMEGGEKEEGEACEVKGKEKNNRRGCRRQVRTPGGRTPGMKRCVFTTLRRRLLTQSLADTRGSLDALPPELYDKKFLALQSRWPRRILWQGKYNFFINALADRNVASDGKDVAASNMQSRLSWCI